jgi:hypothetical protein
MDARTDVLADLARQLARQAPDLPLAVRLCNAANDLLGVDGSAITVAYTTPDRVTVCSTDERAARLEDLQDVLGQGPGSLAYTSGHAVHATLDDSSDPRWPQFSAAVRHQVGAIEIDAFPMRLDHEVLGVLTCHRDTEHPLLLALDRAQFLANAVGVALLRDADSRSPWEDQGSKGSWSSRAAIHQATGMVVAQLHVTPDDALVLLRAHAFAQESDLHSIAQAVLDRDLDFRYDDDEEGHS